MSNIRISDVTKNSLADAAGILPNDEIVTINGIKPRDILEYSQLVDGDIVHFLIKRKSDDIEIIIKRVSLDPIGLHISSAVFDKIRTCDNKCDFCFIYQLPKKMRKSLYIKDDDYRLSFLYGNFTTLTKFTEADLERVVTQKLSPIFVSIHSTNPWIRKRLLNNDRGSFSLFWLSQLLENGIEVHGQIVLCPDINDQHNLEETLETILSVYQKIASVAVVPLGVSRYTTNSGMRKQTEAEAIETIDIITKWQNIFNKVVGRKLVYASDEIFLNAGVQIPEVDYYEAPEQLENGIGLVANFKKSFLDRNYEAFNVKSGFFQYVDGAPAIGYRSKTYDFNEQAEFDNRQTLKTAVLTGGYGGMFLPKLLKGLNLKNVHVITVDNEFFGGNINVAGLLTYTDILKAIKSNPKFDRYLIPDCVLSDGKFLDDYTVDDLPAGVEVVKANGSALAEALNFAL